MEKRSIGPKIIIILLGVLFITVGAAAAISTDAVKWLSYNPVFSQPAQESLQQNEVVPVTGSGLDVQTVEDQSQKSEYGCHHDSAMNPEDY